MKKISTHTHEETMKNNNINQSISDELSILLQIDLLLGHKNNFQKRLEKALNELNKISETGKNSIKH
jgi:hypothetical protein